MRADPVSRLVTLWMYDARGRTRNAPVPPEPYLQGETESLMKPSQRRLTHAAGSPYISWIRCAWVGAVGRCSNSASLTGGQQRWL